MRKLTILFALLTLSVGLFAEGSVITYTATEKLETQFSNLGTVVSHEFEDGYGIVTYDTTITKIISQAFNACQSLTSITLPASITTIGDSAFYHCTSLKEVFVAWKKNIPSISANVFENIADEAGPSGATLYIPLQTKALYEAAEVWKTFGRKVEPVAASPIEVSYIDAKGAEQIVSAWEIKPSSGVVPLGLDGFDSWYVVTGANVRVGTIICEGNVNLILADTAKFTAKGVMMQAAIQVSGEGNTLTIYGQTKQTGELKATGGVGGAGIGSEPDEKCNGITINGGTITAKGGDSAAGIGGGNGGGASNITINNGTVTASGAWGCAGIGAGAWASGSNIFVATTLVVKAGYNNPPTTVIENDGSDLASKLVDLQYVTIEKGSSAAGLEQSVISDQQSVIKVLIGGQLFIVREGKTYTIMGVEE